jgi:hypothetical protein
VKRSAVSLRGRPALGVEGTSQLGWWLDNRHVVGAKRRRRRPTGGAGPSRTTSRPLPLTGPGLRSLAPTGRSGAASFGGIRSCRRPWVVSTRC